MVGLVDGMDLEVARAQQDSAQLEVAGMGLMGLGGLIAIIGGLMFVVVVWNSLRGNAGKAARSLS